MELYIFFLIKKSNIIWISRLYNKIQIIWYRLELIKYLNSLKNLLNHKHLKKNLIKYLIQINYRKNKVNFEITSSKISSNSHYSKNLKNLKKIHITS